MKREISGSRILSLLFFLAAAGCSAFAPNNHNAFKQSGSIILSRPVPAAEGVAYAKVISPDTGKIEPHRVMAPLLGYFPPTKGYLPAVNETWLEIDLQSKTLSLFEGKNLLRTVKAEGTVAANSGDYFILHKDAQPKWYAPDEYFAARGLAVPPELDSARYLKGALGSMALYPAAGLPIHSSAVWTSEVGGLKVAPAELKPLFDALDVGARVVIR